MSVGLNNPPNCFKIIDEFCYVCIPVAKCTLISNFCFTDINIQINILYESRPFKDCHDTTYDICETLAFVEGNLWTFEFR